ncbi:MAG: tRNA guanosine(34) transglycosylase Tgt [Leptospirales bacterium]|nr:tRNA guanosine(34) transglycosylase Tgt [Leptospirales bacterium]
MKFTLQHQDPQTRARAGLIETSRGTIETPVFMPVATRGAIRALAARDIEEIGFKIILANTYHLYIRPGTGVIDDAGGLHKFMNYHRPILTDSGGFQVFSLAPLCKISENGVEFRSHIDGSKHFFSPETVLDIQRSIGSDIMMPLDQCCAYPVDKKEAQAAVVRTVDWAKRSKAHWQKGFDTGRQTLFAIVQGSLYPELRRECAEELAALDLPGYAIGGLSVGEPKELYREITEYTTGLLPAGSPRYMMGVGSPLEILSAIRHGVDMFDCVMPTRIARNGTLYTSKGRINIKAASFEKDNSPLDEACSCYVCKNFSRSYLRHIFRVGEIAAFVYNTYHNLHFMKAFMEGARSAIEKGEFSAFEKHWEVIFGSNSR